MSQTRWCHGPGVDWAKYNKCLTGEFDKATLLFQGLYLVVLTHFERSYCPVTVHVSQHWLCLIVIVLADSSALISNEIGCEVKTFSFNCSVHIHTGWTVDSWAICMKRAKISRWFIDGHVNTLTLHYQEDVCIYYCYFRKICKAMNKAKKYQEISRYIFLAILQICKHVLLAWMYCVLVSETTK